MAFNFVFIISSYFLSFLLINLFNIKFLNFSITSVDTGNFFNHCSSFHKYVTYVFYILISKPKFI